MAELHPQLVKDCLLLGQFSLCKLLLMNDANYPWCILVPDRESIKEIHQLDEVDQQQLMRESCLLAVVMEKEFSADKMNIAALGNIVPQLHIHHIVRYRHDRAWPAPVWGMHPSISYSDSALDEVKAKLLHALADQYGFTQLC